MRRLTETRLMEVTNDLDRIAVAIGTLRQNGKLGTGQQLTVHEREQLLVCQIQLLRTSAKFLNGEITLSEDAIRHQLAELTDVTASIDRTLARVRSAEEVIAFSAFVLQVTLSISSGEVEQVSRSLEDLLGRISCINS